jgi:hypothetical protein
LKEGGDDTEPSVYYRRATSSNAEDERLKEGGDDTEPSVYYRRATSSNAEDERMEEGLEIILNPLNITGEPPVPMLRMREWRRGWRTC